MVEESKKSVQHEEHALERTDRVPDTKIEKRTHLTSDFGALLHILKSSLGGGILSFPYAFKNSGLVVGLIGSCIVGAIVTHTTIILIDSMQLLCDTHKISTMSYADTAEYAFLHGFSGRLKRHARKARLFINAFSLLTYFMLNSYYVIFVSISFKQLIDQYTGTNISIRMYTISCLILIFPIGIIRLMKFLVPFSVAANSLLTIALILIFRNIFQNVPPLNTRDATKSLDKLPIFISTVCLSIEGIGTIIPVENEMKNPKHLTNKPGLLYIGMVIIVTLNVVLGFFGYLKYGDDVQATITLSLPHDRVSDFIKFATAVVILLTYGLQLTVSMQVIWDGIANKYVPDTSTAYYTVRAIVILATVLLAAIIPNLGGFVSLIGALGFTILGIFSPSMIELMMMSKKRYSFTTYWITVTKNVLLILFAVFNACSGTYYSILNMFEY